MFKLTKGMSVGMLAMTITVFVTNPAFAQEVRLSSSDGTVNMTGIFKEFRDNNYVISTALGDMRVSADRVSCIGDACPTIEAVEADIAIGGSDTLGLALMPLLVVGYAVALGAAADLVNTGTGADVIAELIGEEGFGDEMDTILISPTTSGNGFDLLQAKEIEVSMSSRRIRLRKHVTA